MTRPRFTIARLMAIVLFLGLGFGALKNNSQKNAEIAQISARVTQQEEYFTRQRESLTTIIREQRDLLERKIGRKTFELADGSVTAVDDDGQEVVINVTRRQGARPRMKMAIFDGASPGVPNEKLKATIVLTQVGDQSATARVLKTNAALGPIRVGDIVFSPAWSPNAPARFALVGPIDFNRDGKDDREELKRMIEEAGGLIEFDLPPPTVGKETGTLLPRIDWYVTDYPTQPQPEPFSRRMGTVIKEARHVGIRPLTIERLLAFLGYGMGEPTNRPAPPALPK
jgi:hypothetical protein